jgi:hypothetical protein
MCGIAAAPAMRVRVVARRGACAPRAFGHVVPTCAVSRSKLASRTVDGSSFATAGAAPRALVARRRRRLAPPAAALSGLGDVIEKTASPGGRVESELLPKQLRDDVLDAIESLGGAVTVGDVASTAGCKVSEAESAMTAIAADTGAALEVSELGDIRYVFPKDARGAISQKSLKIKTIEPALETAGKVGSYLARVSFGTTLIASIAIVYAAIFALLSNRDSDRDERRGGGGGMFFGPRMYVSPFDFLWYWDPYYYERRAYLAQLEGARDMNFFEAVFSFVFGDGDPNAEFERRRWALVGLAIQRNGGALAAEQLAPFLDQPDESMGTSDESFVLPALTRFGGVPEVDPNTNEIVYKFESMESTAGGFAGIEAVLNAAPRGFSTAMAEEEEIRFSLATQSQRTMAAALGVFNFVGVVALGFLVGDPQMVMRKPELVAAITALLPGLQAYAVSFFAIPAARWFFTQKKNEAIRERNEARLEASRALMRPGKLLQTKLDAAKRMMGARRVVTGDDSVYSSAKGAAKFDEDDFDRRLRERNGP